MKTRLFEYRIQNDNGRTVLKEAPLGDFLKGIGKGFVNTFKKKVGLKTDEEIAAEAEEVYKKWFDKVGFKETDVTGEQDILKKYIIPLGKSDNGVTLVIKKDPEFIKQIENGQIEFNEETDKYKTILQFRLFDVPINLENLKKIINIDTSGLENLAKENNGILQDTNEVSNNVIEEIVKANNLLKSYNLNLFDAEWNTTDLEQFRKSLSKENLSNNDYNLISNAIAKSLEGKKLSMRQLCNLAGVTNEKELANLIQDQEGFYLFAQLMNKGELSQEVIDNLIQNKELPKNYWGLLIKIVVGKFFTDKFKNEG